MIAGKCGIPFALSCLAPRLRRGVSFWGFALLDSLSLLAFLRASNGDIGGESRVPVAAPVKTWLSEGVM